MEKTQLFLLHFAGGNIYSFRQLIPFLNEFDVIPIELPGRGKRANEDLLYDFDAAVTDLLQQIITRRSPARFLLFGHSLGAYLTLPLALRLAEKSDPPAIIFVSGNAGPGSNSDRHWHTLNDKDFIAKVTTLGGMPPELFKETELLDYYLPIIKADFHVAEKSPDKYKVINIPIYAMMGNKEENAGNIHNWRRFTTAPFQFSLFEGGHFFINSHSQKIAETIKKCTVSMM
jgi:external thioesterase TEII